MKFFDRTKEIAILKEIEVRSKEIAQFTIVTGRRRIGKTALVRKAFEDQTILYFFVARKAESDLCAIYMDEIHRQLDIPVVSGAGVDSFAKVFRYVMELSLTRNITLFIDEFQDFYRINKSIFSDMQNIWDWYKDRAKINLIVAGSVDTLMNKIFRDEKEPLFGRQTNMLHVRPFAPYVLKEIMSVYSPGYSKEDLLALYSLTGGVAKYVEMLVDSGKLTQHSMIDAYLQPDSFFISEGKAMLIEEFGKDYGVYFSILTLISEGKNTRSEIESAMGNRELSGYLQKLSEDLGLIVKRQPLFEKSTNKNVHYSIADLFLRFWFRFIYKYSHIIESGGNQKLIEITERDFSTFTGFSLEQYFMVCYKESGLYTRLGYWHDRKGENEIDLIAEDELEKRLEIIEIKRQEKNIDLSILRSKADAFFKSTESFKGYEIIYKGLSIENM